MMSEHRRWCSDEKAFLIGFALGSVSVMTINLLTLIGW